jgi:hypothetical protein
VTSSCWLPLRISITAANSSFIFCSVWLSKILWDALDLSCGLFI